MQPSPQNGFSVTDVLRFAVDKVASDVLITAGQPPMVRVEGDLHALNRPPLRPAETQKLIYDVLSDDQITRFEQQRELDFSVTLEEKHRFRVNCYWQRDSVAAAFRVIPMTMPNLEELGVPPLMRDLTLRPQGLILITGPTGHGKSTTQAALIDIVNTEKKVHIVTIEDPIEFIHTGKTSVIDQREVGQDTHSFAEALRHVLRQDPDVILVGEMRDLETIRTALTAAETGHMVIATLHTNDAVQAIDRMVDIFPPYQQGQVRLQLSFCLLCILSQRLLPRKGGGRRVLATELLFNNPAIGNLVREGKTQNIYSVLETQSRLGMHTMDSSVKKLYLAGTITREEARRWMKNPQMLEDADKL